jgi:formylglycine-generating enzyme required for sulfatase activity
MKPKVEWIKIPAGKFLFGLSDEQKEDIRGKLWKELTSGISDEKKHQLMDLINRRTKANFKFSKEDMKIVDYAKPGLVAAEAILFQVPSMIETYLDTFYVSRYPITNEQLHLFVRESPQKMRDHYRFHNQNISKEDKDLPAMTDWHLADLFSQWLGARLPTVTEWEKAARGDDGRLYPWGDTWDVSKGNLQSESRDFIQRKDWKGYSSFTPIDSFPSGKSPYGVMDMVGNVGEWTLTINQKGQEDIHIIKSWNKKHGGVTPWFNNIVALQHHGGSAFRRKSEFVGFRIVKDTWQKMYWNGWKQPN